MQSINCQGHIHIHYALFLDKSGRNYMELAIRSTSDCLIRPVNASAWKRANFVLKVEARAETRGHRWIEEAAFNRKQ